MSDRITKEEVETILKREEVAEAQRTLQGDQEKLDLCRELLRRMEKDSEEGISNNSD